MARQITYEMCKKMSDYVLEKGFKANRPLAVVITDDAGNIVYANIMDGFHVRGISFAYHKAYTAAKMTRTGREFKELCQRDNIDVNVFCDPKMTTLIGSSPVRNANGETIGAIGVSGWTSDEDQQLCDEAVKLILE
jgi:glc operon protein GlcG